MDGEKEVVRFLFESGLLKTTGRSGWDTVRAPHESVAEHTYRTALVGWALAKMAKLDEKGELLLIKACLFHDVHEARIGDVHKVAKHYVKSDEKKAEKEQREMLPDELKKDIESVLDNIPPKLKILARDADLIECALTAKEYVDLGYKTSDWIENTRKMIRSDEGKKLVGIIEKENSLKWLSDERRK